MKSTRLFAVLLLLGGVVFANALSNPFHFDDHHSIEHNPHIRSLANIPVFFVDPAMFSSRPRGYMYRPLLLVTYAVDYALWGAETALGFRLTNLLLHVGMAALFAAWVRRLYGDDSLGVAAAVLFVTHPVHVETINYISSRSDILVGLLYMGAMIALWQGRRGAGLGAYASALLAKSTAVTLPVMLWVVRAARCGARGFAVQMWLSLAGVTAVYVGLLLGTRFLQESAGKIPRPWLQELWTQAKAPAYYAWLYVSPVNLSIDHPFSAETTPWTAAVLLAAALSLSLLLLAWRARGMGAALGCLWFYVVLGPYLVLPLNILVAERRTYAAGCGLLLVVVWAWRRAARRWRLQPLTAGLLVVLCVLSMQRNQAWASHVDIWTDAVAGNPAGARAHMNLALAHKRAGDPVRALPLLQRGLQLDPGLAEAWVVLGELQLEARDLTGARESLQTAARLDPLLAGVQHNLGNLAMQQSRYADARLRYARTLVLDPAFAEARNNLGQAYEHLGQWEEACAAYEGAIADSLLWTHTDDPVGGAWYNLGRCAETLGRTEQARTAYRKADRLLRAEARFAQYAEQARRRWQALAPEGSKR